MIVIYNPEAGFRRTHRLWRVLDILSANGIARARAQDSTLRSPRLGVIPLGTANVLARELGLPMAPEAVAAALAFGRTRAVWPGIATGQQPDRLFVQMLGVGLDAHVVHHIPRGLKRALGPAAYLVQTLRELLNYKYPQISVRIDGTLHEAASVIVTKGKLYAGAYVLAPGARPGEPGFTVALFGASGPSAALMYGAALTLNLLPRAPGMRLLRGAHVEILGQDTPAQADRYPAGCVPLSIRDATAPIDVVVS